MDVKELIEKLDLKVLCGEDFSKNINGCYCGDLLSWVMGRAKADDAWITIMSNINIVAVASLADVACIILAEGVSVDEEVIKKFYIVRPDQFIYNPRTTRMGDKVGLAYNDTNTPLLFSFNNTAFFIKETAKEIMKKISGRATMFVGTSGSATEHKVAFEHKVLGCNGIYNSFSLGPKVTYDTMPFGFENHLIFASINFRQSHMEKAIEILVDSRFDEVVELIDKDEFTADPLDAYENKIFCKGAPLKTGVIWNKEFVEEDK